MKISLLNVFGTVVLLVSCEKKDKSGFVNHLLIRLLSEPPNSIPGGNFFF